MNGLLQLGRVTLLVEQGTDMPRIDYEPDDAADFAPWEEASGSADWWTRLEFDDLKKLRDWVDLAIDLYPEEADG